MFLDKAADKLVFKFLNRIHSGYLELTTFEGKNLNFCGENCIKVFETYLLPLHGKKFLDTLDVTCFVK